MANIFNSRNSRNRSIQVIAILTLILISPLSLAAAQMPQHEVDKARELLSIIGRSQLTFIRNGKEYSPKEAKAHLETKLEWALNRVSTAKEFVERVASKSLMTGEPYYIKLSDKKKVKAKNWLLNELSIIENSRYNKR